MKSQGTAFGSRRPNAFEPAGFDLIFGKHPSFDFALHAVANSAPWPQKSAAKGRPPSSTAKGVF